MESTGFDLITGSFRGATAAGGSIGGIEALAAIAREFFPYHTFFCSVYVHHIGDLYTQFEGTK